MGLVAIPIVEPLILLYFIWMQFGTDYFLGRKPGAKWKIKAILS